MVISQSSGHWKTNLCILCERAVIYERLPR